MIIPLYDTNDNNTNDNTNNTNDDKNVIHLIDKEDVIKRNVCNIKINKKRNRCLIHEKDIISLPTIRNKNIKDKYEEYKDAIREVLKTAFYNNPYCSKYLGLYIEEYIRQVIGARHLPYTAIRKEGRGAQPVPIDWLMDWEGKEIKVKHISSCLSNYYNEYFWRFYIGYNSIPDAYILSAFKSIESLECMHIWLIKANENFEILKSAKIMKPFWDRHFLYIYNTEKVIPEMNKYEISDKLTSLKNIMKKVRILEDNINDLHRKLTIKQNELLKMTGYNYNLRYILYKAIIMGIGIDDDLIDVIEEMSFIVREEEIDKEIYEIIIEKKKELFKDTGIEYKIKDIIEAATFNGLGRLKPRKFAIDQNKLEEFVETHMEYNAERHIGIWKGNKKYLRGMDPIIRAGMDIVLKDK